EFTVEEGQLYFLQTRDAKRPPAASVRFACDAVDEELLSVDEALLTFEAGDLEPLLHEQFDPQADFSQLAQGVGASPGAVNGDVVNAGDVIAIDGTTGIVTTDDVPLVEPEISDYFDRVLEWCDERRRLGVRANADVGEDARAAIEMGAEGIGLCRTEHTLL